MSHLVEYIAAALLNSADHSGSSKARLNLFIRKDYEIYRGSIRKIFQNLQSQFGSLITEEDVEKALLLLNVFAVAIPEFSPAAKNFWNIKFDNFRYYFIGSEPAFDDSHEEYTKLRNIAEKHLILMAYARNGSTYIEDAIEHISQMDADEIAVLRSEQQSSSFVPASDRVVTLSDNQQSELETASSKLIAEVEKSNGIDGDPTFRQIVLGQLNAGRELIRAQISNAELMRLIMMDTLKSLIKKYEGHVIGAAAATLMELLIKHYVGAD